MQRSEADGWTSRSWPDKPDEVRSLIDRARQANPDAKIGLGMFVAAGAGPAVDATKAGFGDGIGAGMAGPAEQAAGCVAALGAFDVDQVTLVSLIPGTFDLLAPALLTSDAEHA